MAKHFPGPRKQRTRQHVIADQSVNYVQRFSIDAGHTAQELDRDYGYAGRRRSSAKAASKVGAAPCADGPGC